MIDKQRFGKRASSLRRRLALSQAGLAEKLGVSAQAVSKWETGAALPDIELLLELSRLYGVSVNELLEDNGLLGCIADRPFEERGGVAYFVPPATDPEELQWEDKVVAVMEARDGTILDVVRQIKPYSFD